MVKVIVDKGKDLQIFKNFQETKILNSNGS